MAKYDDNVNAQNGSRVAVAHTIHGSPVGGMKPQMVGEANASRIQPQAQAVFSPYKPPKRRKNDNPDIALCSEEGCNAYPMAGKDYCTGHARQHGSAKSCAKLDCNAYPKGGTIYCRWHQPEKVTSDNAE